MEDREAFLEALELLDTTLDENRDRAAQMKRKITQLKAACRSGKPLRDFTVNEPAPLLVHMLTQSAQALDRVGTRVRRAQAGMLHREGMTMDQIAGLFGVSRQRVSALLRGANGASRAANVRSASP